MKKPTLTVLGSVALCSIFAACGEAATLTPVPTLDNYAREVFKDGGFDVKTMAYQNVVVTNNNPQASVLLQQQSYSFAWFQGTVEKDGTQYNGEVSCSKYAASKADCRVIAYKKL